MRNSKGFTLLEILIALFIFTILSMILVGALHTVINADSVTAKNAERLRQLQMALLIMSRDIEQTVNRPVLIASGEEEAAFIGSPRSFNFTHTGLAVPTIARVKRSALQRTQYSYHSGSLWRKTWLALDQAPQSQPRVRNLYTGITEASFQYLDKDGLFQNNWPPEEGQENALPRAVLIHLTMTQWGKMDQLYVISASNEFKQNPPKP